MDARHGAGRRGGPGRRGHPIDDHRASAAYRAAMLGQSLRKLYAESPEEVSA